jgi:PAS domain S-box-containing protein
MRGVEPALAHWLVAERLAIERAVACVSGPLDPASPDAEALRRFRSFALSALSNGAAEPALEGLRVSLRRASAAIDAWVQAAGRIAGADGAKVVEPLGALRARFVAALASSAPARLRSGAATPSSRRAVSAAIDRIADLFLAVDCDSGALLDANPAACALLGLARPDLLARDLASLAPEAEQAVWSQLLDAVAEGGEPTSACTVLHDANGDDARLEVRATRHALRGRTLALFVCRPLRV